MYRYIVHRKGRGEGEEGGYPVVVSGMRVNFFVHGKHLLSTHSLERGMEEKEEGGLKQDCPPSMSANRFRKLQIRKFAS